MCTRLQHEVDITGLSEVRCPANGHCGVTDNTGHRRTPSTCLRQLIYHYLTGDPYPHDWHEFKGSVKCNVVQAVYAPNLDANFTSKDPFYMNVERAIKQVPRSNLHVIAGYWNARPGVADSTTCHALNRSVVSDKCAKCDRHVKLARPNHLLIACTKFCYRKRHLFSWCSNDAHTNA